MGKKCKKLLTGFQFGFLFLYFTPTGWFKVVVWSIFFDRLSGQIILWEHDIYYNIKHKTTATSKFYSVATITYFPLLL